MATSATQERISHSVSGGEAADLAQIKAIFAHVLSSKACTVYLFGSRASGTAQPGSDFDVAVLADEDVSRELSVARDMLEESNIPLKVDVVDLQGVTPAFRHAAQNQGVLLWKN